MLLLGKPLGLWALSYGDSHAACLQSDLTGLLSQGSLTLGKTEANSALAIASPMIVPSKGPRCCFRHTAEVLARQ